MFYVPFCKHIAWDAHGIDPLFTSNVGSTFTVTGASLETSQRTHLKVHAAPAAPFIAKSSWALKKLAESARSPFLAHGQNSQTPRCCWCPLQASLIPLLLCFCANRLSNSEVFCRGSLITNRKIITIAFAEFKKYAMQKIVSTA